MLCSGGKFHSKTSAEKKKALWSRFCKGRIDSLHDGRVFNVQITINTPQYRRDSWRYDTRRHATTAVRMKNTALCVHVHRMRLACPMEAAAIGSGSTNSYTSSKGTPSSNSTTANASLLLNAGTRSCGDDILIMKPTKGSKVKQKTENSSRPLHKRTGCR